MSDCETPQRPNGKESETLQKTQIDSKADIAFTKEIENSVNREKKTTTNQENEAAGDADYDSDPPSSIPSSPEDDISINSLLGATGTNVAADVALVEGAEASSSALLEAAGAVGDIGDSYYTVKWIKFQEDSLPIVMQNDNGPCPLIAIANVLLLRKTIRLAGKTEIVTGRQLISHISEYLISAAPKNMTDGDMRNYEQNINDAFLTFPQLQTGLDVNVRFTGVDDFEYTSALCIFDLLIINLFHGWLVDPSDETAARVINDSTYNQLVEKIITSKSDNSPHNIIQEGMIAEEFLEQTASQLTMHGLCELTTTLKNCQLAVLFRNNHFSTIYKHKDRILVLVTDISLLHEPGIVWEVLNDVDGDTQFVNSVFEVFVSSSLQASSAAASSPPPPHPSAGETSSTGDSSGGGGGRSRQEDTVGGFPFQSDYELALSLQREQGVDLISNPDRDFQLARQMQAEEDRLAAAEAAGAGGGGRGRGVPPTAQPGHQTGASPRGDGGGGGAHGRDRGDQQETTKESKGSGCNIS